MIIEVLGVILFFLFVGMSIYFYLNTVLYSAMIFLNDSSFIIQRFNWASSFIYNKGRYFTDKDSVISLPILFGNRKFLIYTFENPKPVKMNIVKEKLIASHSPVNLNLAVEQSSVRAVLEHTDKNKFITWLLIGFVGGALLGYIIKGFF